MNLPIFKYHPNCYDSNVFEKVKTETNTTCQCCGEPTDIFYNTMYCRETVNCLCPMCVSSGAAAKKYSGKFVQDAENIDDCADKTDELFHRTPGYVSWQGENWLAHCNDYCAYIGDVGAKELEEMGIAEEVFADYAQMNQYDISDVRSYLVKTGSLAGYLFQCLHCEKYRLWVDAD